MESPKNSRPDSKGFTLIEILIAVAILAVIMTLGLFISWDFYRGFTFLSEQKIILSVLQKARNQAMSNINEKPHGVYFDPGCYIIFEGTYNGAGCNSGTNEVIKVSPTITFGSPGMQQATFSQLNGDAVVIGGDLVVKSSGRTAIIKVNTNGQIDVQ